MKDSENRQKLNPDTPRRRRHSSENAADAAGRRRPSANAAGAAGRRSSARMAAEEARAEKARERKRRVMRIRLVVIGAAVAFLVIWYSVVAASYKNKFLPNTTINGFDVSGLSADYAESLLKNYVEDYSLELAFRGGVIENISNTDVGLSYVSTGEVSEILADQNRMGWLARRLGKKESYTVGTSIQFKENLLKSRLNEIAAYTGGTDPVDAHIVRAYSNFYVMTEIEGNRLDQTKALEAVENAILSSVTRLTFYNMDGIYLEPSVRSDDEELNAHCDELNAFAQRTFTINCKDDQTETVGPEELAQMVTYNEEEETWMIDEDDVYRGCYNIIQTIANRDNDYHTVAEFSSTSEGTVTLPCYEYGYEIDVGDGAQALYNAMEEDSSEPVEMVNSISEDPMDTTETYIEVDVTKQVLYFYQNGKVFFRTNVVTGLESDPERRTPSGIFTLQGKDTDRILGTLTAVDPSARYESHVDYWMPFYYSYGMHDASWRDEANFGGTVYKDYGSHGCINLPPSSAKKIFENAEIGTPVVVLRSGDDAEEGTELGNAIWNPPEGGLHYTEYDDD